MEREGFAPLQDPSQRILCLSSLSEAKDLGRGCLLEDDISAARLCRKGLRECVELSRIFHEFIQLPLVADHGDLITVLLLQQLVALDLSLLLK